MSHGSRSLTLMKLRSRRTRGRAKQRSSQTEERKQESNLGIGETTNLLFRDRMKAGMNFQGRCFLGEEDDRNILLSDFPPLPYEEK